MNLTGNIRLTTSLVEQDDANGDIVEEYLRERYEPLISADGKNWRMLQPFDAVFKNNDGATEVWLEARIYHFSVGSIGKVLRNHRKHEAFKFFEGRMPWRMRFFGHREDVIFGNATEASVMVSSIPCSDSLNFFILAV